jgi:hypothetical protein
MGSFPSRPVAAIRYGAGLCATLAMSASVELDAMAELRARSCRSQEERFRRFSNSGDCNVSCSV